MRRGIAKAIAARKRFPLRITSDPELTERQWQTKCRRLTVMHMIVANSPLSAEPIVVDMMRRCTESRDYATWFPLADWLLEHDVKRGDTLALYLKQVTNGDASAPLRRRPTAD